MIKLINKDPDYLDSHLLLSQILQDAGDLAGAEKVLNKAYEKALELIADKKGDWPDSLAWGWLENRHIVRTFLNKAISFWTCGESEKALDIFRKLLRTKPGKRGPL